MAETSLLPSISVIIPTFNRAWTLKEAVDSVLAQDYPRKELIVVDDGSTDNTPALLETYGDRLSVIRQPNRGVSAARNRGVQASTGQFIAFLDSDDAWLQKKLSRQVQFFSENPHARICQTEEIWIRNGIRINPKVRHRKPSGDIFERSLDLCLVSPSAVMLERRLFEEAGGFDEDLPACEDYDLWLRIGCHYPVYRIDEPLIVKRGGHEDQLSRAPGLDRFRIHSLVNLLESGSLSADQYRAAASKLVEKCRIYMDGCKKRGKVDEASYYQDLLSRYS